MTKSLGAQTHIDWCHFDGDRLLHIMRYAMLSPRNPIITANKRMFCKRGFGLPGPPPASTIASLSSGIKSSKFSPSKLNRYPHLRLQNEDRLFAAISHLPSPQTTCPMLTGHLDFLKFIRERPLGGLTNSTLFPSYLSKHASAGTFEMSLIYEIN